MVTQKRKRGRPLGSRNIDGNPDVDAVIGRTVWQLQWWGFGLRENRSAMLEAVAKSAARAPLLRCDSRGLPLSAERIKQIFQTWARTTNGSYAPSLFIPITRTRQPAAVSKDWRRAQRPRSLNLDGCVAALLQAGGHPPATDDDDFGHGDRPLTDKPYRDYLHRRMHQKSG